jgi:3-hydroxyacyl-[acyl-carrier-protein] dehydratase
MLHSTVAEIESAIPHRPPFLLVDEIVSRSEKSVTCRKTFGPDEYFFAGHYPDYPLVPGVLLCEAALQAGAILMSARADSRDDRMPVVTRMNEVRFKRPVLPGETIDIDVTWREQLADASFFEAKVTCNGKLALRFEFACTLVAREPEIG